MVQSRIASGVIGPVANLAVGAVAGVVNVLATTPLWMVSTQLAVQVKHDQLSTCQQIFIAFLVRAKAKKGTKKGEEPYSGMFDGLTRCYNEEGLAGARAHACARTQ